MTYQERSQEIPRLTAELHRHVGALQLNRPSPVAPADIEAILWGVARRELMVSQVHPVFAILLEHHTFSPDVLQEAISHPELWGVTQVDRVLLQEELTPFLRNYLLVQLVLAQQGRLEEIRSRQPSLGHAIMFAVAVLGLWGSRRRWECAHVLTQLGALPESAQQVALTLMKDACTRGDVDPDGGPRYVKDALRASGSV